MSDWERVTWQLRSANEIARNIIEMIESDLTVIMQAEQNGTECLPQQYNLIILRLQDIHERLETVARHIENFYQKICTAGLAAHVRLLPAASSILNSSSTEISNLLLALRGITRLYEDKMWGEATTPPRTESMPLYKGCERRPEFIQRRTRSAPALRCTSRGRRCCAAAAGASGGTRASPRGCGSPAAPR
eukprot:3359134-Rhodomonas_salina.1